jgi:mannose-6-phosphate isomerase-like protein (cupin superfamily)
MKHLQIKPDADFKVLAGTSRSQAAIMVLQPQETTGGPDNKHDRSDQWLYVISGQGKAIVTGQEIELGAGSLLLIEAGETHEIKNTSGSQPLETLNFYTPPEY